MCAYHDLVIDTANNYQNEESETWIGEWMAKHKNRDQIVLATKFSSPYNTYDKSIPIHANFCGNHTKSLRVSVEDSLKKLQTDYIDLLYVHWCILAPLNDVEQFLIW